MEICCSHQNRVKDHTHPGLERCLACDVRIFKEDLVYWKQPWHLPKNMWRDTFSYLVIISGTILAAFIVKEIILHTI